METKCPNCNSANVEDSQEKHLLGRDLGFGITFSVEMWDQVCGECGFIGSFNDEMDKKYEKAHLVAHDKLIQVVSDRLRSIASDVEIERTFHLFPRTLKKWREAKDITDTSTALFKLLAKHPHILDAELKDWRRRHAKANPSQE